MRSPGSVTSHAAPTRPDSLSTLELITRAFAEARAARLPKVAQLYNAVVDAIASGRLESGSKLPGERELSGALGISLGTAQKSLALLSRDGQIIREHGRGSFVQMHRRPLHELWHYRFRDPATKLLLPVYARLLDRRLTSEDGPWVDQLGTEESEYVQVTRLINVGTRLSCWSRMTLGASRFRRLLELPDSAIENVNLKMLLLQEFDAPTIAVRQSVSMGPVAEPVAGLIDRKPGSFGLILQITALSRGAAPISYQTIVVPPTDTAMELGTEPSLPGPSRGFDTAPTRG